MYSILNRLTDVDQILKQAREELYDNKKIMLEVDNSRVEELEQESKRELENIEKFVYEEFKRIIDSLKVTQDKYKKENSKLTTEVMNIKKEKADIQAKIKDLTERAINARRAIGNSLNESNANDYY